MAQIVFAVFRHALVVPSPHTFVSCVCHTFLMRLSCFRLRLSHTFITLSHSCIVAEVITEALPELSCNLLYWKSYCTLRR